MRPQSEAVREAGIEDFRWHDLRHTFATRLREKGVPLEDIADLLGHKGLAMTRRYAHTNLERLHQAVGRLARKPFGTKTDTGQSRRRSRRAVGAA
ncbi:MAG: tyrosine-type recombinase/integrase [Acidobacteriia bacterium]|nr:tyrosine-type recombinase/integrase [Terriglobia bacterium]